jgi:hypothetical protein
MDVPGVHPSRGTAGTARGADAVRSNEVLDDGLKRLLALNPNPDNPGCDDGNRDHHRRQPNKRYEIEPRKGPAQNEVRRNQIPSRADNQQKATKPGEAVNACDKNQMSEVRCAFTGV